VCGIAGFLRFQKQKFDLERRQQILNDMGSAIARRGPDEQTFYDDEMLSFVFRRLSIIDVDGGQQPIWNEDRSIFVAVNGEIYNHRELREPLKANHTFRTESDSEVVLHLYEEYGEACFERLNGMFAIVLWDTKRKKLLLARDPLGVKPLYYTLVDEGLIFASELKALLVHPDCPRELAWNDLDIIGVQQKARSPPISTTCTSSAPGATQRSRRIGLSLKRRSGGSTTISATRLARPARTSTGTITHAWWRTPFASSS